MLEVAGLVSAGGITLDDDEKRTLRRTFGSLVDGVFSKLRGFVHLRSREMWVQPDPRTLQIWIQCPDDPGEGDDVRYERDGSPHPGNGPEFDRLLTSHPVITAWDGSLLVYERGSMDGLAESLWP